MAHFAQIDDQNMVIQVQVIDNSDIDGGNFPESEALGQAFQASLGIGGTWLQCSYSGSFRGSFPSYGWTWKPNKRNKDGGEFIPPAYPPMPELIP